MKRTRQPLRPGRANRPPEPDPLAEDPLLARLARTQAVASRQIAVAATAGQPSPRQRREALVTLAELSFALDAMRATRDEMRSLLDVRITAYRAVNAYHRAETLSEPGDTRRDR